MDEGKESGFIEKTNKLLEQAKKKMWLLQLYNITANPKVRRKVLLNTRHLTFTVCEKDNLQNLSSFKSLDHGM